MNLFRKLHHYFYNPVVQVVCQLGNQLIPTHCLLCGCALKGELLCEGCLWDLPWLNRHDYHCQQCALTLSSPGDFCGHCLQQPPAFDRSCIPFAYQDSLKPLIHRFKYRRKLASGKLLGQMFAQYIVSRAREDRDWRKPDLLVPAPMHWTRRWQRGFNQAEILSQYLSRATGIATHTRLVQRRQRTPAQKELTRGERQKNLRNAFYISPAAVALIQDKSIALVDDVVTTTATMRELSKMLVKAGAKEVQVWALARTMNR